MTERERVMTEHAQRAQEIYQWIREHGSDHHRVRRYISDVNTETVATLINTVKKELEAGRRPDSAILLHVFSYLEGCDFSQTDEAGRDTAGFSLAVSELDVALRHLKLNPENALRYLVYRYKLKAWANSRILLDFTPLLYIEAALACNLMCKMCYQSDPELQKIIRQYPIKLMDWDLFTKIIDEAAERGCCAVVFAGRGEPTLNPRFSDMLRYCHQKGILDIKFNTNAMTLSEKMVREWLSLGAFLTIVFSADAADKQGYEQIRIGGDFDKVVNNIKTFKHIRCTEFPDSPVRTRVSMTVFNDGQDGKAAEEFWTPLVDEFAIHNALSEQSGSIYQNNPDGTPKDLNRAGKCRALFTNFHVWCDGTVNPCENDYKSCLQVGNAHQESLQDLWNGPKMMRLRMAHMSGKKNMNFPCNGCTGY